MNELPEPSRVSEPVWLEPYPNIMLEGIADQAPGQAARYESKETIALAFVAGLQHLPPQQRAVLVLRDVLSSSATEVAEMRDSTEAAVNRLLRRARTGLENRLARRWPRPHAAPGLPVRA
jgi:RNA polymerase sigma-70 factor (ECF subfamily)